MQSTASWIAPTRVTKELKLLDRAPSTFRGCLRGAAAPLLTNTPFVAKIDRALEPNAYADAERMDARALDFVRALARADAARDHRAVTA